MNFKNILEITIGVAVGVILAGMLSKALAKKSDFENETI